MDVCLVYADTGTSLGDWLQLIVLFILFVVILVGAYLTTKFFANFQIKKGAGKNIKLVEATPLGPGKFLQLVKVGEKYLLVGVTKDRIVLLNEIDKEHLSLDIYDTTTKDVIPFQKQLEKLLSKKKDNNE